MVAQHRLKTDTKKNPDQVVVVVVVVVVIIVIVVVDVVVAVVVVKIFRKVNDYFKNNDS